MTRVYFFSDVHLGIDTPEVERTKESKLLSLLDEIRDRGTHLYIVGDLFDFWFEYKYVIPRGFSRTLAALGSIVEAGVKVTYLVGNHDFAIGTFFSNDLEITVEKGDLTVEHDGKTFYLFHGDGLAQNDSGYRLLRRVIRHPLARKGFSLLHPSVGFRFARLFSHGSRDYTSRKFYGETDGMRIDAERRIRDGIDFVIMGHRHLPILERIDRGWYVNLGDWLSHDSYAVYENDGIQLLTYRNGSPESLSV